jgi:hypothetical protein
MSCVIAGPAFAGTFHEHEPNDSPKTASGPILSGSIWGGALTTSNDVDYYKFYTRTRSQIGAKLTDTADDPREQNDGTCDAGVAFLLENAKGETLEQHNGFSGMISSGQHKSLTRTVAGPSTYYLAVEKGAGCNLYTDTTYTIQVTSDIKLLQRPADASLS